MTLSAKQLRVLNDLSKYIPALKKGLLGPNDEIQFGDILDDLDGAGGDAQDAADTAQADVDALETSLGDAVIAWHKITVGTGTSAEVDSTYDLPAGALVLEVIVEVNTVEATGATKTLDVGLLSGESGGDADGFIDGISVATAGLRKPAFVQTTGSNNNFVGAAATHTRGVLMTELLIAGEDIAAGGDGVAIPGKHFTGSVTAKSVSYSRGSTFSEFAGVIWIKYVILDG